MNTQQRSAPPSGLVERVTGEVSGAFQDVRDYLASEEGARLRRNAARVLIFAAPLLLRSPFVRATPLGRAVGLLGGTALVVKAANALRDWTPQGLSTETS